MNNHLGNANKMVETPRTETYVLNPLPQVVSAEWARQLERELNAANESFRKLNIHALDLAARIKRLEEAGDAIVGYNIGCGCGEDGPCRACCEACEEWTRAKEAKP